MIAKQEFDLFSLKVLSPILIITLTKFVIYKGLFLKSKHKQFQDFFFASSEKKLFMCTPDGMYCPIKAEIRAVDSQSALKILL